MKAVISGCLVFALFAFTGSAFAQDHDSGEAGIYGEYLHLNLTGNNFAGVGVRAAGNVSSVVQIEGQLTYDFAQSYTTSNSSAITTSLATSKITVLHGLIGPKVNFGTSHARLFGTLQGGVLRFSFSNGSVFNGFTNSVGDIATGGAHGALYPGVGGEFFAGKVGLRLDVGDLIYWAGGAHNTWDVRLGPQFRF